MFHWEGQFYAYANMCLHQGGPACEGLIMHQVEDVIGPDKTWVGQKFSEERVNFVCPWHGYEYDIKTGECAADRRLRLKKYNVVRRGDDIFVSTHLKFSRSARRGQRAPPWNSRSAKTAA